jgi:hypothetical protein
LKTFLAYAKLWWGATFGVSIGLFGWPYTWEASQYSGWATVYGIGIVVLMILAFKRILK